MKRELGESCLDSGTQRLIGEVDDESRRVAEGEGDEEDERGMSEAVDEGGEEVITEECVDEPHIGGLFAHQREEVIQPRGAAEVDEGEHEDEAEQSAEDGDGERRLDDEEQAEYEKEGELYGDGCSRCKEIEDAGDFSEDVVLGAERTCDKREGADEDDKRDIDEAVIDQVALIEFDDAIHSKVEEARGEEDKEGMTSRDQGEEEGGR